MIDDAVARQDTVTLLVWQISTLVRLVPMVSNVVATLPGWCWYEHRVKPDGDWADPVGPGPGRVSLGGGCCPDRGVG